LPENEEITDLRTIETEAVVEESPNMENAEDLDTVAAIRRVDALVIIIFEAKKDPRDYRPAFQGCLRSA